MLYQATVRPIIDGTDRPGFNYASVLAAGGQIPEFIETGFDADFSFDIPGEGAFRSRTSPVSLDTTGKGVIYQDNAAGRYIQLNAGQNGLVGPTPDAREMTYFLLYNYRNPETATALQAIAGTMGDSSSPGGELLYVNSTGSVDLSVSGYASSPRLNFNAFGQHGFPAVNTTNFLFIAATSRLTGGADQETEHSLFIGGPTPQVSVRTGVKTLSTRKLAMGNAYRTNAAYAEMPARFNRFVSGRGSRTVAELTDIYKRAKIIAARDGVALF